MKPGQDARVFALLVRSHPYQRRSARAELDVAMAALTMEFRVEVYFIGSAVLQLLTERDCAPAGLPAAYRAWASMPDLGEARLFAERAWLDRLADNEMPMSIPVEPLDPDEMRRRWRLCSHSMVV